MAALGQGYDDDRRGKRTRRQEFHPWHQTGREEGP